MMMQHVGPHTLDHAAVVYLEFCELPHYPLVLKRFLCFEFRNPMLGQKLYKVLVNLYIMDDILLYLEGVYFIESLVVFFGHCVTRLKQLLD